MAFVILQTKNACIHYNNSYCPTAPTQLHLSTPQVLQTLPITNKLCYSLSVLLIICFDICVIAKYPILLKQIIVIDHKEDLNVLIFLPLPQIEAFFRRIYNRSNSI